MIWEQDIPETQFLSILKKEQKEEADAWNWRLVSHDEILLREIPENEKEKCFYTASRHLKVYAIYGLVMYPESMHCKSCMLLTFKATNDHAHQILHYWLLRVTKLTCVLVGTEKWWAAVADETK
jgi:hypothetical protein